MSKKRSHQVAQPKRSKNVITLKVSALEQVRLNRKASRDAEIEAGMTRKSGVGAHGGGHRAETRRERHRRNQEMRSGSFD